MIMLSYNNYNAEILSSFLTSTRHVFPQGWRWGTNTSQFELLSESTAGCGGVTVPEQPSLSQDRDSLTTKGKKITKLLPVNVLLVWVEYPKHWNAAVSGITAFQSYPSNSEVLAYGDSKPHTFSKAVKTIYVVCTNSYISSNSWHCSYVTLNHVTSRTHFFVKFSDVPASPIYSSCYSVESSASMWSQFSDSKFDFFFSLFFPTLEWDACAPWARRCPCQTSSSASKATCSSRTSA